MGRWMLEPSNSSVSAPRASARASAYLRAFSGDDLTLVVPPRPTTNGRTVVATCFIVHRPSTLPPAPAPRLKTDCDKAALELAGFAAPPRFTRDRNRCQRTRASA